MTKDQVVAILNYELSEQHARLLRNGIPVTLGVVILQNPGEEGYFWHALIQNVSKDRLRAVAVALRDIVDALEEKIGEEVPEIDVTGGTVGSA